MRHLLVALLVLAGLSWADQVHAAKRNIVLFVTDDQGQDAGCYGNEVIKTPNMDALAKDGTRFDYAFCTTASCSASRSVILTGMFNHANGHYGHQHSYHKFSSYDDITSLPVILAKAGYRTARCGKYHVAPEKVYHFETTIPGNSRHPVKMAENCQEFITEKSSKPFFLYFCTSDPHRGGGRVESSPYKEDRFGNKDEAREGQTKVVYDPKDVIVPSFLPDTPTCRAELAQYYQSVSRIDQGLGRLIEILKEAEVYDHTLFVYISDHGIAFPGGKTTVYEPGLRSPCLVRAPEIEGTVSSSNAMISWIDLTPTLLDFAGAFDAKTQTVPAKFLPESVKGKKRKNYKLHGRSILPVLKEKDPKGWDEVNASHTFHEITMYYPMRVVRGRQYKLIWNIAYPLPYPFASDLWAAPTWQDRYKKGPNTMYGKRSVASYIKRPQFELYDLKADPDESKNLANDPKYADILAQHKEKIKKFQDKTNDPWKMKWKYE